VIEYLVDFHSESHVQWKPGLTVSSFQLSDPSVSHGPLNEGLSSGELQNASVKWHIVASQRKR
jgi:hypothetical protein